MRKPRRVNGERTRDRNRGVGFGPLETQATHARTRTQPVDPRLHGRERGLELEPESTEHHDARRADIEGYPDVGGLFRDTSEAETGHAFGHLDFLKEAGDPVTGLPIGSTEQNLKSAIDGETYEFTEMYPGFAKAALGEGFEEIAEWFETLAKAEKSHAGRFTKGLQTLSLG